MERVIPGAEIPEGVLTDARSEAQGFVIANQSPVVLCSAGLRAGKTRAAGVKAMLAASAGLEVICLAPNWRRLMSGMRETLSLAHRITERYDFNVISNELRVAKAGRIRFFVIDPVATKNFKADLWIIDEAQLVPEWVWGFWRPTAIKALQSVIFCCGGSRPSYLSGLAQRALAGDQAVAYYHYSSEALLNISATSEVAALRRSLTERNYRREIGAEFVESE